MNGQSGKLEYFATVCNKLQAHRHPFVYQSWKVNFASRNVPEFHRHVFCACSGLWLMPRGLRYYRLRSSFEPTIGWWLHRPRWSFLDYALASLDMSCPARAGSSEEKVWVFPSSAPGPTLREWSIQSTRSIIASATKHHGPHIRHPLRPVDTSRNRRLTTRVGKLASLAHPGVTRNRAKNGSTATYID